MKHQNVKLEKEAFKKKKERKDQVKIIFGFLNATCQTVCYEKEHDVVALILT